MSMSSRRSGFTDSPVRPGRRAAARLTAVQISTPRITLGEFLKWSGVAPTGGAAKILVQGGRVSVNGIAERRRGRQIEPGDRITVGGREYQVVAG